MSRRQTAPAAVRWTAYIGVAVVFAIACGFLAHWQLSKNVARSAQLAVISQNYDASPVPIDRLLPPGADLAPAQKWHPVTMTGRYLSDDQVLARNRVNAGQVGYDILVPFHTDQGRIVLVDRGWEPTGNTQSLPEAIPQAPSGNVTVTARLMPSEPAPGAGRSAPAGQVAAIHLSAVADAIGGDTGTALETGAYGALVAEDPAPATAPQALEAPSADPGPYLSYGIQWLIFAVMGFVFIWYVIRSERRLRREEAEDRAVVAHLADVDPAAAASARDVARARRRADRAAARGGRDAQDEDALLDRAGH